MATGRHPITSDKRPSVTVAAAVTARIAAEIDPKVRHSTEEERTDWPDDQRGAVGGNGGQHDNGGILSREEHRSDDGGKCSVEGEVVPLHGIAETEREYGSPQGKSAAEALPPVRDADTLSG
jgi:hypothetical protein